MYPEGLVNLMCAELIDNYFDEFFFVSKVDKALKKESTTLIVVNSD